MPPFTKSNDRSWFITAATVLFVTSATAQSQMLQQPPQVGGASMPPNLVFTLDDSGSMWWECLPDDLCTSGSNGLEVIPRRDGVSTGNRLGTMVYDDADVTYIDSKSKTQTAWSAAPNLLSRQLRSSSYNPLYYNPSIRYQPWLKADGTRYSNANPSAAPVLAGESLTQNLVGNQTVSNNRWYWSKSGFKASSSQTAHLARYYTMTGTGSSVSDFTLVKIESGKTYTKGVDRTDCAGSTCTYNEEIQNFANWYTYYRTRALTAIGGTAEAFGSVPSNYRVGYGSINSGSRTIDGVSTTTLRQGVRTFSGTPKDDFYTWLFSSTEPSGGTPLRQAMSDVGKYFSRKDNKGPWGANPGTDDKSPQAACRRNFHILMTDGKWNGNAATESAARGNTDGTSSSTITGPDGQSFTYTAGPPYSDTWSNTLADVAMYYWKTDLRPDLDNIVQTVSADPVKGTAADPAFWQHMVNFTIAFGVDGTLDNPGDLAALTAGTKAWPEATADSTETVDDLWHAAINSRGRALSARNSAEYATALNSIIDQLKAMEGSDAGVGVSATTLPPVSSTSRMYTPLFKTPEWSGDIRAETIDSKGILGSTVWNAANKIPAPSSRNIFTYNPAAMGTKGVPFTWTSLTNAMKTDLWGSTTGGEPLIAYLRGDSTDEGTSKRKRGSMLGDIVNSTPALVKDLSNANYEFLPPGDPAYGAKYYLRFLKAKALRQAQIIVGANDGMLHAFSDADGTETFAYMPRNILGSVKQLADPAYTHRYFVDGPVYETDVYDQSASKWRNLIQGSGGAGGKYVYTIRMPVADWTSGNTPPAALSTTASAPGASDILWEIDNQTPQFEELGYTLTRPVTGVTRDGTWVTIFGNGYESASGKAQLFVVNALTGAFISRIDTGVAGPSASAPNGLGGVGVVLDGQRRIVAAYAGDLLGNVWKFDFSAGNPASAAVAFGGKPLYTAKNTSNQPEPIFAKPQFRAFPTGGVMVLFGTGKLFSIGDQTNKDQRTLYGIWDKLSIGGGAGTAADVADPAKIVSQSIITTSIAGDDGNIYRKLTINPVDFKDDRGWKLPLSIINGERLIDEPQLAFGSVFMQTVIPVDAIDDCRPAKLQRRGYMLDPFMSGKAIPAFKSNSAGKYDSQVVDLVGVGANRVLSADSTSNNKQSIVVIGARDPKDPSKQPGIGGSGGGGDTIQRYWREIVSPSEIK